MRKYRHIITGIVMALLGLTSCQKPNTDKSIDHLLSQMTLEEKIGQMCQINTIDYPVSKLDKQSIVKGEVGSILNEVDVKKINHIQRIAVEESRLGIPILFGRDVIHGFKTVFPIPLGMAASWNPALVEASAHIAAKEARSSGVRWTFAPMLDLSRDPRWGRIAESFGEDPLLGGQLGAAMIKGFQSDALNGKHKIAACAKHFVGYGAAEGGRDYNTALIPIRELHDQYFPPFEEAIKAGVLTFMSSFNEIDGIPSTGNKYLFRDVLRDQWHFDGFVVSDWKSTTEMIQHGFVENEKQAAERSIVAGVDMEMVASSYKENIHALLKEGKITEKQIDEAVLNILRVKKELNLFDDPYIAEEDQNKFSSPKDLVTAKKMATQSMVLLKNDGILPLNAHHQKIALIGPMADQPYEQLGTWNFDGDASITITPRMAFEKRWGKENILFAPGLEYSRDKRHTDFNQALSLAKKADVIVFCAGEEAILSGEAHSRAHIDLPGAQSELISYLKKSGKPIVLTVFAGRPLVLNDVAPLSDAIIYGWHPGTMGGEALADIVSGEANPSGKLPLSFPKSVGQIPIHYNHKNTGRPVEPHQWVPMDEIPVGAVQTSLGNTSHYLDDGYAPAYPFGYGLSYTSFEYSNLKLDKQKYNLDDTIEVRFDLTNTGDRKGTEITQLYIRDLVGNVTRPVKELQGFKRITLEAGQRQTVTFKIPTTQLSFHDMEMKDRVEAGRFQLWVGGDANTNISLYFELD